MALRSAQGLGQRLKDYRGIFVRPGVTYVPRIHAPGVRARGHARVRSRHLSSLRSRLRVLSTRVLEAPLGYGGEPRPFEAVTWRYIPPAGL